MSYTLKNIQDKYFLQNTGGNDITFTIKKSQNCVTPYTIYECTLIPSQEYEIKFIGDGEYTVQADDNGVITERIITYYLQLQTLMIEDIKTVLCGCENCECSDDNDCSLNLSTKNKIDVFKRLVNPQLNAFLDITYDEVKCFLEKEIYCDINNEIYNGDLKYNENLFKKLIALDYLAIYFFELISYCLPDETCYVDEKFKTNDILCCIEKLGIDINNIRKTIEDMGTLTINSAAYINQPPSQVGDNTISVANRAVTTLTLAMFTTDTTPVYADPEGDAVVDVRIDTIPADGTLELNGVAVTPGQIIPVADINNSLLVYTSPNQDPLDADAITFSLRDAGSGQFAT